MVRFYCDSCLPAQVAELLATLKAQVFEEAELDASIIEADSVHEGVIYDALHGAGIVVSVIEQF